MDIHLHPIAAAALILVIGFRILLGAYRREHRRRPLLHPAPEIGGKIAPHEPNEDAIKALRSLGYTVRAARDAVESAALECGPSRVSTEELVKKALQRRAS